MGSKEKTVIVLTPNGRRQSLTISLDAPLIQVLENVCKKHGYNANEYALRHSNKILDSSTLFRFSGLSNNTLLELVPNKRISQDGSVILCLQVEGENERFSGEFLSNVSLDVVLSALYPSVIENITNKVPVLVYMRREIIGLDEFKKTTLHSLGLTSGRALLRLTMRDSAQHPELQCTGLPKLTKPSSAVLSKTDEDEPMEEVCVTNTSCIVKDHQESILSKKAPDANIITTEQHSGQINDSAGMTSRDVKKSPETKQKSSTKAISDINYDSLNNENKDEVKLDEIKFLEERSGLPFRLEENCLRFSHDVADSFFDVTVDDMKLMLRDMKRNRESMENAPLLTSKLRQQMKREQLEKYTKSVIRIQFPNRHILQGIFEPTDTISNVANFVKNCLDDQNSEFYFYTSPPKTVLNMDDTLVDADCIPCAKIYFAFTNRRSDESLSEKYLHDKVLPYMTSQKIADFFANHIRGISVKNNSVSIANAEAVAGGSGLSNMVSDVDKQSRNVSFPNEPQRTSDSKTLKDKLPKWFKPV